MTISKTKAYFWTILLIFFLSILNQLIWLFSGVTRADIIEFGHGSGRRYKAVEYVSAQYFINHNFYTGYYLKSDVPDTARVIEVRYLVFAPSISRLNTRVGTWGLSLVVFVVLFSCVSIIFLKKDIIAPGSRFVIGRKFPYVRVV